MTWQRFRDDESGASLIEYTVVFLLFILVFFATLDFGRLGFNWVMTEKAMQRAARIAVTRPPLCNGVPETQQLAAGSTANFGTLCRAAGAPCENHGVQQCVLGAATDFDATNPCTAPVNVTPLGNNPSQAAIDAYVAASRLEARQEIWCLLNPVLPSNATPANIRISYSYDPNLGFAGGPYVPMVEVGTVTQATEGGGAEALQFTFVTPLPMLALMIGGASQNFDDDAAEPLGQIDFPDLSVSMPGEDLNRGSEG